VRGPSKLFTKHAAELQKKPGVVGVFWGSDCGGRAHFRVHVEQRRPKHELAPSELLPRRIGYARVRVVQVGVPTLHALSAKQICENGTLKSTVTGFARGERTWNALCCGHGVLPPSDALTMSYAGNPPVAVSIKDIWSGTEHAARLTAGGLDEQLDWAVLSTDIANDEEIDLTCPATVGGVWPSLYTPRLPNRAPVSFFSCRDGISRDGIVWSYGNVTLQMPGGESRYYTQVLEVSGDDNEFSNPGDSGALVVSRDRAIGIVLGASAPGQNDHSIGYVLPLAALADVDAANLSDFYS
jgi:hypothetical protein